MLKSKVSLYQELRCHWGSLVLSACNDYRSAELDLQHVCDTTCCARAATTAARTHVSVDLAMMCTGCDHRQVKLVYGEVWRRVESFASGMLKLEQCEVR